MKILVVCQYYRPEEFRINDICESLASDGHSVTVLTGLPNYPSGDVPWEYRWGRQRSELLNGVRVIRTFEIGRRSGVVRLALNYASFMVSASLKALLLRDRFDVIFVYQLSPVTMAVPAIVAKKRFGTPLFLYCFDLWPESLRNILVSDSNLLFKVVGLLSGYIYSQCDSIAVTSRPFVEYFHKRHAVSLNRIVYIPQHAEQHQPGIPATKADDCTNFVFMGNIGMAQDIECILDAAEALERTPRFRVHFVGDGSYLKAARASVKRRSLEDVVIFHGRRALADMHEYYSMADACLLTLKAENWIGLTMPSKLQGYMSAGKPVIGAINGAAQEVIAESRCGICVSSGDSEGLAAAMNEFMKNPNMHQLWGANGLEYYQTHFTKAIFMDSLESELYKCADNTAVDLPKERVV